MVSMATHNATLKNGVVTTKSMISRLMLNLDYLTWYQIKAKTHTFNHMVRYAN